MRTLLSKPKRLILPLAILLVMVVLVVLVGVRAAHTYDLTSTPPSSATPQFAKGAKAVAGWEAYTSDVPQTNALRTGTYRNTTSGCTFTTGTVMYPNYFVGRTDLYITKYALYDRTLQKGTLLKGETTGYVPLVGGGKLQFATGHFTVKAAATSTSKASSTTYYVGARAIDKLYKLPASAIGDSDNDRFGLDASKGLPVLTAEYSCPTGKGSATEFNQLLDAVSVELN